jgi:hypothetical protein
MKLKKTNTEKEFVRQKIAQQYCQVIIRKLFANNAKVKDSYKDLFLGDMTKKSLEKRYNI